MISYGAFETEGGIYWVTNDNATMYEQALLEGDQELVLMLEHRVMMHDGGPCNCEWEEETNEILRRNRSARRRPRR